MTTPLPPAIANATGISRLLAVVAQLRDPRAGCPWDLKQTHQSLRPFMLEEAYEAVETMAAGAEEPAALCEELGDVLLQVALHAQIAGDAGLFDFEAVAQGIADKLIRRHPHVFGEAQADTPEAVTRNWQAIKQAEKAAKRGQASLPEGAESILAGVSMAQPALSRALETSRKAVKAGFAWPTVESLWQCVMSEFDEFRELDAEPDPVLQQRRREEEMGDILFAVVNLAREYQIDPEVALTAATTKFTRRFQSMESRVASQMPEKALNDLDFETWDTLWNQAKGEVSSL
ncbi:MAG: nucleoside triphosphate pyrophosphohydrolase [Candidatus Melainabacteria bacterium]